MFLCISLCYFATLFMCIINAKVFAQYIFSVSVGFFLLFEIFHIKHVYQENGQNNNYKTIRIRNKIQSHNGKQNPERSKKKISFIVGTHKYMYI